MKFFSINIDKKGVHVHFHHKLFLFLIIILLLTLSLAGFFLYQYLSVNYFDSSVSKNELQDLAPLSPPVDIQRQIQQIRLLVDKQASSAGTIQVGKTQIATAEVVLRVPILMYHYVEYVKDKNDKTRISLNTPPEVLEQEIKTLSDAGYTFMTTGELADCLEGKVQLPPKPVVLTFDDGYRDFYTYAYPILKKYHAKATQYVISGFLGQSNHLLVSQLQEIAKDGLVEIGAHTVRHMWLKGLPLKVVSSEVFQSRVALEQLIKKPVISFAYPFGAFDNQTIEIVKAAGFRTSVSTLPGVEQTQINKFFLFRLRPGGRVGQRLLNLLNQKTY